MLFDQGQLLRSSDQGGRRQIGAAHAHVAQRWQSGDGGESFDHLTGVCGSPHPVEAQERQDQALEFRWTVHREVPHGRRRFAPPLGKLRQDLRAVGVPSGQEPIP